jgi:hypothetical protein
VETDETKPNSRLKSIAQAEKKEEFAKKGPPFLLKDAWQIHMAVQNSKLSNYCYKLLKHCLSKTIKYF